MSVQSVFPQGHVILRESINAFLGSEPYEGGEGEEVAGEEVDNPLRQELTKHNHEALGNENII